MRPIIRPALLVITASTVALAAIGAEAIPRMTSAKDGVASVRVMSFNIRTSAAADGENAWSHRSAIFFESVWAFQPDLIGLQEVLADQYDALGARLPGYGFSGRARDDGARGGEWSLVGFRRDRFHLVGQGDFWLSARPDAPGSKSWDAALPRLCSWVRLRELVTGREFVFANTHFDHKGVVARREAVGVLNRELGRIAGRAPVILTGDLNVTEDDGVYRALVGAGAAGGPGWIDAYRAVHPLRRSDELSFHGFAGGTTGSRIDYIFHTAPFAAVEATIDHSNQEGRFPSDHYAVTAVLVLRP